MQDHNQLAVHAAQDEQAFEQLYRAYIGEMHGFVMKRIGHRQQTEDIVADIFMKVVRNLPHFDPAKASFRTWLYCIASTRVIDHYRSAERRSSYAEGGEHEEIDAVLEGAPDALLQQAASADVLRWCLDKLEPEQRQIVQLRFYDDFTQQQIADVTSKTRSNVGVIIHRVVKQLRECFDSSD